MRLPHRIRRPVLEGVAACAIALAVTPAWAQTTPAQAAQTPSASPAATLHSTSTLVLVPALVQTPAKDMVYSLTTADFELTDNGVPQTVALEPDLDTQRPLALVVVLQTGGEAASLLARYKRLDTMLAGIVGGPPNQVAVVNFGGSVEWDYPFTSNVSEWTAAITHPEPGHGGGAIFDALAYALNMLKRQPPDARRAILLVSQQHDDGSRASVKDIIRTVGETNTAVYSLTFSVEKKHLKEALSGFTHYDHIAPAPPPIQVGEITTQGYFDLLAPIELGVGALRTNFAAEVAGLSGGEPFTFSNEVQFDRALNSLANHIHNGYTLSFRPTSSSPGLHNLQLRVRNHPEYLIDARTSYWAGDAEAPEKAAQ